MLILVSGGSGSGKSEFAEGLIVASPAAPRIYIATMRLWDLESEQRVARHREMRADKGFATLECPVDLMGAEVTADSAVLVEDLSNLVANEYYGGEPFGVGGRILGGVQRLRDRAALTVVVTNELFSDGIVYNCETEDYLACLADLNRALSAMADEVYEVVCGIPVCHKGAQP
ncbi:MAG: bifunctional adenosylcobinamide kinase/adenosylcobinamide-phosphate guanylyltransferase [Pseudoflavonifractor sp.]